MSRRGDDQIIWDSRKVEANDPEAVAAIKKAEEVFNEELKKGATAFKVEAVIREAEYIINEERKKGATAFRVEDGKTVKRIGKFDRTAEQIVIVPRVVGG
jgi:uncharacterized protein YjiK